MNILKSIKSDGKTKLERMYQDKIKAKVWEITKKVMIRSLKTKDVDELEKMYNTYFEKYPDPVRQQSSKERIAKLRKIL